MSGSRRYCSLLSSLRMRCQSSSWGSNAFRSSASNTLAAAVSCPWISSLATIALCLEIVAMARATCAAASFKCSCIPLSAISRSLPRVGAHRSSYSASRSSLPTCTQSDWYCLSNARVCSKSCRAAAVSRPSASSLATSSACFLSNSSPSLTCRAATFRQDWRILRRPIAPSLSRTGGWS
jgi:hypothetical protein